MAVILVGSTIARAEPQVSLVDGATVRILTIGTVDTDEVKLPNTVLRVAKAHGGHGTGFVVGSKLIMTAAHVVKGARHVVVRLPGDGGFFPARVAFQDDTHDTAVLVVDDAPRSLPPALALRSERPTVRQSVFAVGYPIDATRRQPQSARGIVAGYMDNGIIQVDMTLNPGNSGGPLVDEANQVLGMVIARGDVESGVQGIGYVVPVSQLAAAISEAERRASSGLVPMLRASHKLSAIVVDEMVQHGALAKLADASDLRGSLLNGEFDRVLEGLLTRVDDPDLLVAIAAAMWNAALVLEHAEPDRLARMGLNVDQSRAMAARLRGSASRACDKAIKADTTVGTRSPFVAMVAIPAPSGGAGRTDARTDAHADENESTAIQGVVFAGPYVRWNPGASTTAWGGGLAAQLLLGKTKTARAALALGASLGGVVGSTSGTGFTHSAIVADLGGAVFVDDNGNVALTASAGVALYRVSDEDGSSESAATGTLRFGVMYMARNLAIGGGLRTYSGPTLWLEPITVGFAF